MNSAVAVNPGVVTTAPLKNVAIANNLMQRLIERPRHLPGMGVFYGPSGWGKSVAGSYVANKHRAYYVQCRSIWPKKALLKAILHEMGIPPARTIYEMVDQIIDQLVASRRPLMIDEMDHLVAKKDVELIRDIYEGSGAPILMIGEEKFPAKLREWERFHNRILCWQQAQPSDMSDVRHLARLYAPRLTIDDELLDRMLRETRGVTRRICVNLETLRDYAVVNGIDVITVELWAGKSFDGGDAPRRGG